MANMTIVTTQIPKIKRLSLGFSLFMLKNGAQAVINKTRK